MMKLEGNYGTLSSLYTFEVVFGGERPNFVMRF